MKIVGHWMAEELRAPDRRRHFVPQDAHPWHDAAGAVMGWVAGCGTACIPAGRRYLSELRDCAECVRLHPAPTECR
jgi:hypothetical protein